MVIRVESSRNNHIGRSEVSPSLYASRAFCTAGGKSRPRSMIMPTFAGDNLRRVICPASARVPHEPDPRTNGRECPATTYLHERLILFSTFVHLMAAPSTFSRTCGSRDSPVGLPPASRSSKLSIMNMPIVTNCLRGELSVIITQCKVRRYCSAFS